MITYILENLEIEEREMYNQNFPKSKKSCCLFMGIADCRKRNKLLRKNRCSNVDKGC